MEGAVLLRVSNVKLRRGDAKSGAKATKGTLTLTETHVIHVGRDGAEQKVCPFTTPTHVCHP